MPTLECPPLFLVGKTKNHPKTKTPNPHLTLRRVILFARWLSSAPGLSLGRSRRQGLWLIGSMVKSRLSKINAHKGASIVRSSPSRQGGIEYVS